MGEQVFMKDVVADTSLGRRMDKWYEETGASIYKDGDKFAMIDINGENQGSYTLEDLIDEYEFESANSKVPKRCVEDVK